MDPLNQGNAVEALVPPEKPLAMPEQSFQDRRGGPRPLPRVSRQAQRARLFVFGIAAVLTAYATWEMYHVVGETKATVLQIVLVLLFASTFAWIALSTASALLGLFVILARTARDERTHPSSPPSSRTAIVMPIYNEDTIAVFASLRRMMCELVQQGQGSRFDLFVLSDSTNNEIRKRELEAARKMSRKLHKQIAVYYRNREVNEGKKAGNIADFVRRWGGHYESMIVLDADSYMTPEAIMELVKSMENDPHAGLIQTVPRLANGRTLFARMQQFASEVYAPVLTLGLALWHSDEGNYWGHNAIIRVKAFASACGLPKLAGRKPFGGHILSHDFIEAALLRRSGFAVYMRPDISGSYEGTPPTFADYAVRDRRWAQGNLQHSKIVPAAGLHWVGRFHLLNGIMTYLASPLWLLFMLTGLVLSWQAATFPPDYFPEGYSLFPTWPRFDAARALSLLGLSALILLAPKILALTTTLLDSETRRAAGGAVPLALSVVCEVLLSALLAPIAMLVQTRFVLDILLGREAGWETQQRQEKDAPLRLIVRQHLGHTLAGVALCFGTLMISTQVWLWLSPVWIGLCSAIPLVALTSRRSAGEFTRKGKLFVTPTERSPIGLGD
jgi:membrane glycosyltransferase